MKVVGNIFKVLLAILLLITGAIAVCIINPDITASIASKINPSAVEKEEPKKEEVVTRQVFPGEESYLINPDVLKEAMIEGGEEAVMGTGGGRAGLRDAKSDYVAPSTANIKAPDNVSGKNGYEGISVEDEEIADNQAEKLWNELGPGYTGEGLDFDAEFYPFFHMLDNEGQNTYRQIYANANGKRKAFTPIESNLTSAELKTAFEAVVNDHPELFWMNTGYSAMFRNSGSCVEINLKFNRTADDLDNSKAEFELNADQIVSGAMELGSAYDKEKYVHDTLVQRINYNSGAEMNQSAYSALVNDSTVCAGYARAFQYCMQKLGIPTYYCTGYAGESHAWNIVSLDDGYYNVDTTWDDTDNGTYAYFNKTDADYGTTHARQDLSIYLPPCNGTAYRDLEADAEGVDQEPESSGNEGSSENTDTSGASGLEQAVAQAAANRAQTHAEEAAEAAAVATPAAMKAAEEEAAANAEPQMASLEEYGIKDKEVLHNISEYYANCKQQIESRGVGEYQFYNVISGESVMQELYTAYRQKATQKGFLNEAVSNVGGTECSISVEPEQLRGGQYLLRHRVVIR